MLANNSRFSGTSDIPACTRAETSVVPRAMPSNPTWPRAGNIPMTAFSSVDLPAPFGPITVTISPAATLSDSPSIAGMPP